MVIYDVVGALIEEDGRFLVAQRKPDDRFGSMWEFPGGKIKKDEDKREALKREIKEEIGIDVRVLDKLPFFFVYDSGLVHEDFKGKKGMVIFFVCEPLDLPNLARAEDNEFSKIQYIGKEEFFDLREDDKIMIFDKKYLPEIMEKLELW